MGRIEPTTEPDLDQRDVEPGLREMAEDDRGQQLELGRFAVATRDAVRDGEDRLDVAREGLGVDRSAIDLDALAIGDEMGLGRLTDAEALGPERTRGQRETMRFVKKARAWAPRPSGASSAAAIATTMPNTTSAQSPTRS